MGYYSETGLALTKNGIEILQSRLADENVDEKTRQEVKDLFKYARQHHIDPPTGAEAWYWDSIKWYSDEPVYYPEIDFIEQLLSELDEDDYRFIRIGEDYDDTEVRGDFWDNPFNLEISRGIALQPVDIGK